MSALKKQLLESSKYAAAQNVARAGTSREAQHVRVKEEPAEEDDVMIIDKEEVEVKEEKLSFAQRMLNAQLEGEAKKVEQNLISKYENVRKFLQQLDGQAVTVNKVQEETGVVIDQQFLEHCRKPHSKVRIEQALADNFIKLVYRQDFEVKDKQELQKLIMDCKEGISVDKLEHESYTGFKTDLEALAAEEQVVYMKVDRKFMVYPLHQDFLSPALGKADVTERAKQIWREIGVEKRWPSKDPAALQVRMQEAKLPTMRQFIKKKQTKKEAQRKKSRRSTKQTNTHMLTQDIAGAVAGVKAE